MFKTPGEYEGKFKEQLHKAINYFSGASYWQEEQSYTEIGYQVCGRQEILMNIEVMLNKNEFFIISDYDFAEYPTKDDPHPPKISSIEYFPKRCSFEVDLEVGNTRYKFYYETDLTRRQNKIYEKAEETAKKTIANDPLMRDY
jgi:hypothetical protein